MTGLDEVREVARIATQRMHSLRQEAMTTPVSRVRWTRPLPHYTYSGGPPPVHHIDARVTVSRGRSYRRLLTLPVAVFHQLARAFAQLHRRVSVHPPHTPSGAGRNIGLSDPFKFR